VRRPPRPWPRQRRGGFGGAWAPGILNVTPRLLWIQNSNKEPPTVTNRLMVAEVHFPSSAHGNMRWPGRERVTVLCLTT
jgi:hypothetical protein